MKKLAIHTVVTLLLGVLLVLAPRMVSAQCSMCKTQVEAARTEKDAFDPSGLNKGILYMAAVPYLLIGVVGYFWYRNTHSRKLAKK